MGSAEPSEEKDAYTAQSFGAVFAEVAVDKYTHMVKVRRIVATYDIGTLMNDKTGLNQLMGGIVWGVSFALHEESHVDPVYGRTVNDNLAEYHVPVNADIGTIDVTCLNIPTPSSARSAPAASARSASPAPPPPSPTPSTTPPASASASTPSPSTKSWPLRSPPPDPQPITPVWNCRCLVPLP